MRNDSPESRDYAVRWEDALFRVLNRLDKREEKDDENDIETADAGAASK
jgi:hypothetical protein